eukprot:scaffold88580_cov26-Tisochrysis_lutea.AAC.1
MVVFLPLKATLFDRPITRAGCTPPAARRKKAGYGGSRLDSTTYLQARDAAAQLSRERWSGESLRGKAIGRLGSANIVIYQYLKS